MYVCMYNYNTNVALDRWLRLKGYERRYMATVVSSDMCILVWMRMRLHKSMLTQARDQILVVGVRVVGVLEQFLEKQLITRYALHGHDQQRGQVQLRA